jgi:outer membrane protein insertion porin family
MKFAFPFPRAAGFLACCVVLWPLFARAQSAPGPSFHLSKISVAGQEHLEESSIVAASGLRQGQSVTLEEVSAAALRLAKYGAFDTVNFRYFTQGNDLDVIFEVVESKHLLACRFDNFVWLNSSELDRTLRQQVPLFTGGAPPSGAMLQGIKDALQAILKEKGVAGTVEAIPYASAPGQPVGAIRFRVSGISLPIAKLSFPGASAISEDELERTAAKLLGQDFSMTDVAIFAKASLVPLYGERGYLRARFGDPAGGLDRSGSAPAQGVSVTIPVDEGVSYDWNGAVWSGNHLFTTTDLNRMLGMKRNEVADTRKYDRGIADVNDAYSRQGYIQLIISSDPEFDDGAKLVTYRITIQEGPQFRMGSLEIIGLPPDTTKRLLKSWRMQTGEIFDQAYMKAFVKTELPKNLRFTDSQPANISTKIQPDPNAKKVDVQIGVN